MLNLSEFFNISSVWRGALLKPPDKHDMPDAARAVFMTFRKPVDDRLCPLCTRGGAQYA